MARFYKETYDPQKDSGTSGIEVTDLNPEKNYDVDLRRVDPEVRKSIETTNEKQVNKGKFFQAAKTAGEYIKRRSIAEPTLRGRTPISKAEIAGVELPSLRGRFYGNPGGGSTAYARKPKATFGDFG